MSRPVGPAAAVPDYRGNLVDVDPNDLQARSQLIVYYFGKTIFDPVVRRTHSGHVLWLIANAPQADVHAYPYATIDPHRNAEGYLEGKRAWMTHLEEEPTNVTFYGHAATFFSEFQDRDLVVETLQKVQSLDPDNSRWPMLLGHLYLRNAMFSRSFGEDLELPEGINVDDLGLPNGLAGLFKSESVDATASAVMALDQFQRAYELADSDMERRSLLGQLATAAFQAQRYEDARAHATSLLQSEPGPYSDESETHKANIVLGRVALVEDDVALARHHLVEAGRVEGSAPLGSFGPLRTLDVGQQVVAHHPRLIRPDVQSRQRIPERARIRLAEAEVALHLDVVEETRQAELADLPPLLLGAAVGQQGEFDASSTKPFERRQRTPERRNGVVPEHGVAPRHRLDQGLGTDLTQRRESPAKDGPTGREEVQPAFARLPVAVPEPVPSVDQGVEEPLGRHAVEGARELGADPPPRDIRVPGIEDRVVEIENDRLRPRGRCRSGRLCHASPRG